jgi:4-amino-4-deoxy-L-arabinose transferase-like glycosyltransferase
VAVAIAALYLFRLDTAGVFGPDEPRYIAIGRSMAESGDLITPRLWGSPWFEKPPLLYWMTAAGTALGLNPELSGRLPVALVSLTFLAIYYLALRPEYSPELAAAAAMLLATSAGWLAYSSQALTDLPLAVCFSCAVLLALPLLKRQPLGTNSGARMLGIGASLGLAMLAKGLVPLALSFPFLWFLRAYWRKWWLAALGCVVIAGPWYTLIYLRNGWPFVQDFILKQHFARLYSSSLQHVQPAYYYVPILLAGVAPWTPLLAFALRKRTGAWDSRSRFLITIAGWGILFFSLSRNKLPGYLLPLMPSLFILMAVPVMDRRAAEISRGWLVACGCLIGLIPLLATILPQALAAGKIASLRLGPVTKTECFYVILPIAVAVLARRSWAGPLLALCFVLAGFYLKERTLPLIDEEVSARALWRTLQPKQSEVCDGGTDRSWFYGLAFYRQGPFPPCNGKQFHYALRSHFQGEPQLEPIK